MWRLEPISVCINKQSDELYILLQIIKKRNNPPTQNVGDIKNYLIIYDLNAQNIKHQLSLNVSNIISNNIHSKSRVLIKEMYAIYNQDNNDSLSTTTTNIINHWTKQVFLPKEIYCIIHQFYTFIARKNAMQVLILTEDKDPGKPPYYNYRIYKRTIYHGMIDLNNLTMNDNEINLEITNKNVIEYDDDRIDQRKEATFLLLRVKHDIFWIFDKWEKTWRVNLNDGSFEKEKYMTPYPATTYGCFHGVFDKYIADEYDALSLDQDKRYLNILVTQGDYHHYDYDLVCFDREPKDFMMITKKITDQEVGLVLGMKVFNNYLHVFHQISSWAQIVWMLNNMK